MAFNASGIFERLYSWQSDEDNGIKIRADRMDAEMDGFANAINALTENTVPQRGPVRSVFGTVAEPGYVFDGDADTGFYRSGPDQIGVAVNGGAVANFAADGLGLSVPIISPTIHGPVVKNCAMALNTVGSTGAAVTFNLSNGNVQSATVDQNTTVSLTPPTAGQHAQLVLYLTNGGAHTITWPAAVKWDGNTAPTLQTAGLDVLAFTTTDGGANWRAFVVWAEA